TGSIGDRVWNDADGDRLQGTGESGIPGVTVTLTGSGPDGVFGTADDLLLVTTTGAGGFYRFAGLPAGTYQVAVSGAPLTGLGETYELDGSLNGTTTVILANSQARSDVDFGYAASAPLATGSIGDRLWLDVNGNGVQDAGEPGLAGVTVNLIDAGKDGLFGTADDVVYTQITDANGNYQFTSLPAGSYRVDV
ncbi:MAG: hypothetical protein JST60_21985, partial [Chloroflexi bacterium SZAS-1]|nr:hypothetical protein [Chloroflexi bacterium SZAS-1]